uniref:Recombinase family protein n=1 Tax=Roseihalotalea indica TaxID=2867963 RepID=A0AA49GH90_9BACT|nr:recombinase family protein [Tunicatimonas sp. TK19036]
MTGCMMDELEKQGIAFRSIQESIDTSTSGGKLIFHMFGALAEFERNWVPATSSKNEHSPVCQQLGLEASKEESLSR